MSQSDKFTEAARELEAEESEANFEKRLKRSLNKSRLKGWLMIITA